MNCVNSEKNVRHIYYNTSFIINLFKRNLFFKYLITIGLKEIMNI